MGFKLLDWGSSEKEKQAGSEVFLFLGAQPNATWAELRKWTLSMGI